MPKLPKSVASVQQAMDLFLSRKLDSLWCRESDRVKLPPGKSHMGFWFRGQACSQWALRPGVFRSKGQSKKHISYTDETSLHHHFRLRQPQFEATCGSTFDWLTVMQHHLLPTRLLDWTESILVGLYFAVGEPEHDKKPGKLFILDARRLNQFTGFDMNGPEIAIPGEFDTVLRSEMALTHWQDKLLDRKAVRDAGLLNAPGKVHNEASKMLKRIHRNQPGALRRLCSPIGVFPKRNEGRMVFQSSMFTLHGGKRSWDRTKAKGTLIPKPLHLEEVARQAKEKKGWEFLGEVEIPAKKKAKMREDLRKLGIHEGSLFPEADYQSRMIRARWVWNGLKNKGKGDP